MRDWLVPPVLFPILIVVLLLSYVLLRSPT